MLSYFSQRSGEGVRTDIDDLSAEEADSSNSFRYDSRNPPGPDKIAERFLKENKKIQVWTYLFKQLTNATELLLGMCEMEGKTEFCKGVIDSLASAQEEFGKLEKRLHVEKLGETNESKAWDLRVTDKASLINEALKEKERETGGQSTPGKKLRSKLPLSPVLGSDKQLEGGEEKFECNVEKYADIFDEEGLVEFQLLLELMHEGKLSFYEATVLLIRERASLMVEEDAGKQRASLRKQSDELDSRAVSTPLNVKRLFQRIHKRIQFEKVENDKNEEFEREKLAQRHQEKLKQASDRRLKLNQERSAAISKTINRVEEVKMKHQGMVSKRQETIDKKEHDYYQRKLLKLAVLKNKAKESRMKASEITLLQLIEKNAKKRQMDAKLEETRKRRVKIVNERKLKNQKAEDLLSSAKSRKEQLEKEKKTQLMKRLNKLEEAQKRRQQLLEEKVKKPSKTGGDSTVGTSNGFEKKDSTGPEAEDTQRVFSIYLLEEKQRLDKVFKNSRLFERLSLNQGSKDDIQSAFSEELRASPYFSDKSPDVSFDLGNVSPVPKASKKRRKRNRKDGLSQISANESVVSVNMQENEKKKGQKLLSAYYKFLTKDAESLSKIRKLKLKNLSVRKQTNAFSNELVDFDADFSEFAELLYPEAKQSSEQGHKKNTEVCFCSLCDAPLAENETPEMHLGSKGHKRLKTHYGLTFSEDTNSVVFISQTDLAAERLRLLRLKSKKIKQQLATKSFGNEGLFVTKETGSSLNKPRLQKLTLEFEKGLQGPVKDYELLNTILLDIGKIIEKNVESDLHVLRQVRFVGLFVELIKSVSTTPKIRILQLTELFNQHYKTFAKLALLKETRSYLLLTNRALPLVDFLTWSWSLGARFIQCLQFIPQLLQTMTLLLKTALPKERTVHKSFFVEYIMFSGFLIKAKSKLASLNFSVAVSDEKSKVQNVIHKLLSFLETLTGLLENGCVQRLPENAPISPSVYFVLLESDIAGCIQLLASLLLSKGQYHKGIKSVPKTLLSQSVLILKILNNCARGDLPTLQKVLGGSSFNADQFYHIQAFLYDFCTATFKSDSDCLEVFQELIQLTGYFCLRNVNNQTLLSRGTESHTIIYKLANLPYEFYFGDQAYLDLLFPTLLAAVDNSTRNLTILLSEVSKDILLEYVRTKIELYHKEGKFAGMLSQLPTFSEKRSHSGQSNAPGMHLPTSPPVQTRLPIETLPELEQFISNFEN